MPKLSAVLMLAVASLLWTAAAHAQSKTSGRLSCTKPDPVHVIPVGDRPGHVLGVLQYKCNWATPMQLGTDSSKDGTSTETFEASGDKTRAHGTHVATMHSGALVFISYRGVETTSKDGALVGSKGTWAYSGGTGKLKGLKGKGTYRCTPSGDASVCDIEGDYQLAK
jgi:hypothetical protein